MAKTDKLRQAILAARDLRQEPVSIPEWPGVEGLFVRARTVSETFPFSAAVDAVDNDKFAALTIAYSLCHEDGTLVFDPATDLDLINSKSPAVILRLYKMAQRVNGDGKEAEEERGEG
jgi:hypothetical protein